ncbi:MULTISPECIES: MATE family efflux transporter [unclassified Jeotgalibaca]|uniref:MATE family efflux transporter n=1 Tax=unclassified Jeotgalibaca TaxID=2621505 RepID=UPI003FD36B73
MTDMTVGKPLTLLIKFTIPLILGNLFQQLYSLIDTMIVGRTLGLSALGAIGAVASLTFFLQGFIQGIASGLSLVLAQRLGMKDGDRIRSSFISSLLLSLVIVVLISVLGYVFSDFLLSLMHIPVKFYSQSKDYFIYSILGLGAMMLFHVMINSLRSMGSTRQLLYLMVLSQILNIIFDFLFVIIIPLGVKGVALAIILSQFLVGIICYFYLSRRISYFKIQKGDIQVDKREIKLHLKMSLPIGIQSAIITIGSIILQLMLNTLGSSPVEAHAIGQRIEAMIVMPLISIGVAMATFAAQNAGAGLMERVWQGIRGSLVISLGYSLTIGLLLFFFGTSLSQTLFGADDPETLMYIERYLQLTTPFYMVLSVLFVIRYTLQGIGKAVAPTLAGLMEMTMRILVPLALAGTFGFTGILVSHPMAWIGSTVILVYAIRLVKKNDDATQFKRFMTS